MASSTGPILSVELARARHGGAGVLSGSAALSIHLECRVVAEGGG
jgi:hypothetical protein